jgi:hypothetical protein
VLIEVQNKSYYREAAILAIKEGDIEYAIRCLGLLTLMEDQNGTI